MRVRTIVVGFILAGAAAVSFAPAPARACSCLPTILYDADPNDGAVDVPLNAARLVMGSFDPGSITVEDARGERVEVTINHGPQGVCASTWACGMVVVAVRRQ